MSDQTPCPDCSSPYGYSDGTLMNCPECGHSWSAGDAASEEAEETGRKVLDANGNTLQSGDTVMVVKDLPVKGAPKPVKAGTKVKNIRLVDGDHDISCRIDGFGKMGLKSEFVRKV